MTSQDFNKLFTYKNSITIFNVALDENCWYLRIREFVSTSNSFSLLAINIFFLT